MPLVPVFDPTTGVNGGAIVPPSTGNSWVTIEDFDWTQQATSAALVGAGTATMGGKSVSNTLISGVPTYQTQCVNGTGLLFTGTAAGAGGAVFRYDLDATQVNPGEPFLLELLLGSVNFVGGANTQFYAGYGTSGHISQGEWNGSYVLVNAGLDTNMISRGYSSVGGARTVTIGFGKPQSTDYLVQVWYDGGAMGRLGSKHAQTTFLAQPLIGSATPFAAGMNYGTTGTGGAITPTNADLRGIISNPIRVICGFSINSLTFALKRHRFSRPVRM